MAMRKPGTWAPLSSHYFDDTAIMEAGEDAELLYVRMLAYASRQMENEGYITDRVIVSRLGILPRESGNDAGTEPGTDALSRAERLREVGLLARAGAGYAITAWLKWNKSAEEMGKERTRDRDRKSLDKDMDCEVMGTGTGNDAGKNAGIPAPRPDQTRPEVKEVSTDADAPSTLLDEPKAKNKYTPEFEAFWKEWPNGNGKLKASQAFKKALEETTVDHLIALVPPLVRQYDEKGWNFPMAATWLNGERWNDEGESTTAAQAAEDQKLADRHPDADVRLWQQRLQGKRANQRAGIDVDGIEELEAMIRARGGVA